MARQTLEGIRVLDIATVIAAPYAASILGDFGAEVIKVEMTGRGDAFRGMAPLKDGKSIAWASMGRNKKSVTLDFHYEEGKKLFLDLVKKSDVVIENFKTGTLDKWGIGVDAMRRVNPDIIVTHVTGYGQTGPNRHLAGLGMPLQAFSGMVYLTGYEDRPPVSPPFPLADYVAGLYAVIGTMFALYHRDAMKGATQEVDISLYEGIFRMEENFIARLDQLGILPTRHPMSKGISCPIGNFETADGQWLIMVCSTNPVFMHLCDAMERPEWKEKYATVKERLADQEKLTAECVAWFKSRTYDEIKAVCDRTGVPISKIMSMKDIFDDPQYAARNDILTVKNNEGVPVKMPGVFPVLTETPGQVKWAGPKMGSANREIYGGLLGYSDDQLKELEEKGII